MKIDLNLLKNPEIYHFEDDEYVIETNYGQLGGTFTSEQAFGIRQWIIEAAGQLEREKDKVEKFIAFPESSPNPAA